MERATTAARGVADFCYVGAWVAPIPSLVIDGQSVVFANAAAVRLLAYSDVTHLIGQQLDRVLHSDALVAEMVRREVVSATRKPLLGVPTKLRSSIGEPLQELANVFPIDADDRQLTLLTFETKRAADVHAKLAPAPDLGELGRELGWAILELMATPVLIQDLDTILFVNASGRGYLGAADRGQIEGRPIVSFIHADGLIATIERVIFVFATHQKVRNVPLKLKACDGRVVYAEGDAYPMQANGRWGVLVVGKFLRDSDD